MTAIERTLADSLLWDESPGGLDRSQELVYPVVGLGSVLFNSLDTETDVEFICENLEGWAGLPPGDPTAMNREFDYGSWSGPGWYGPRTLLLTGVLLAPSRLALQLALHKVRAQHWRTLRESAILAVAEVDSEKRLGVRTSTNGMSTAYLTPTCLRVEIELTAAWPVKRGLPKQASTGPPGRSAGRHYPRPSADAALWPGPGPDPNPAGAFRRYGPLAESGNLYLTNDGNAPVRPQFHIAGPCTNPTIWHSQQHRHLTFLLTLADGDRLFVDADTHAVLLNDIANRRHTLATDAAWFDLDPGPNTVQYRPEAGAGTLTVYYSDGWW